MKIINSIEELDDYKYSKNNINWEELPLYYILTNDFIKRYQNKLNWKAVSMRHQITVNFIKDFKDKIHWDKIVYNPHFSEEMLITFIENLSLDDINNFFRINSSSLKKKELLEKIKLLNKI